MSDSTFSLNLGEKYVRIAESTKSGSQIQVKAIAYDEAKANIYVTEGEKPSQMVSEMISKLVTDSGIKKKALILYYLTVIAIHVLSKCRCLLKKSWYQQLNIKLINLFQFRLKK